MGKLLSPKMEEFLKDPERCRNKSEYYRRVVKDCGSAFDGLEKIARYLPEEHSARVFTPGKILPFIYCLLGYKLKVKLERHYQLARLLASWSHPILEERLDADYMPFLLPELKRLEGLLFAKVTDPGYTCKIERGKLIVQDLLLEKTRKKEKS